MSHGPVRFWQKIWAKRESGLTAVRLKWDPPVYFLPQKFQSSEFVPKCLLYAHRTFVSIVIYCKVRLKFAS